MPKKSGKSSLGSQHQAPQGAKMTAFLNSQVGKDWVASVSANLKPRQHPKANRASRRNVRSNGNGVGLTRTVTSTAPAAVSMGPRRVGMSDLRDHAISWLAGYVYVGNGTLGATDSIYAVDPTKTETIVPAPGLTGQTNGGVPIVEGDTLLGATYAADVVKHYARKVIKKVWLDVLPLQTSTTNSMIAAVAPMRGPGSIGQPGTGTAAGNSYNNVLSMAGFKQCASWEGMRVDMTPYIAGGSGAKQNEYDVSAGDGSSTAAGGYTYYTRGVVPCTFSVSGSNSTTSLRGTVTHSLIVTEVVDLLDSIGGNASTEPELHALMRERSVLSSQKINCETKQAIDGFQRWLKSRNNEVSSKDEKGYPPPSGRSDSRDCSSAAGSGIRKVQEPPDPDSDGSVSGYTFVDGAPGRSVKGLTIGLPKTGIDTPQMRTRSVERPK